jgi:hypothetical protein
MKNFRPKSMKPDTNEFTDLIPRAEWVFVKFALYL